jgi:hypothetical protein
MKRMPSGQRIAMGFVLRPFIIAMLCLVACYPDYKQVHAPALLQDPIIPTQWHTALQSKADECAAQVDSARQAAYDAHKSAYRAATFGGAVTFVTGGGAGALGIAEEGTWSAVAGGLSLVSGVVTIIWANKDQIGKTEAAQTAKLDAWSKSTAAISNFEAALIKLHFQPNDDVSKTDAIQKLEAMNSALTACGAGTVGPEIFAL